MATTGLEVEFQIVAIRCGQCRLTEEVHTELEANRFTLDHGLHKEITHLAKITAPPEMASERIIELEFGEKQ